MNLALDLVLADLPGLALLSAVLVALLVGVELAGRALPCPREWIRKAAHIGSGLILLAVPWLVGTPATFAVVAVTFAGGLALSQRLGVLGSIHGVSRQTDGVVLFPLGAAALFALADGDPFRYCVPLLVLTVSDSLAALVGQKLGRTRYRVGESERTLEGSAAFVLSAAAITWAGLAFADVAAPGDRPLVAGSVALVACAIEAVSFRGWDNLWIPVGSWAALELLVDAPVVRIGSALGPAILLVVWIACFAAPLWVLLPRLAARGGRA